MDLGLDGEFESDDSFFDDPKTTKRGSLTNVGDKKSIDELFGSLEDKKPDKPRAPAENIQSSPSKGRVRFDLGTKSEDWLGQPEKKEAKGADLLDDILSVSSSKQENKLLDNILPKPALRAAEKKPTFEDILKDSKAGTTKLNPKSQDAGFILEPPREKRRGRRGSSAGIEDVLGLFSEEHPGGKKVEGIVKASTTSSDIPDWLSGSAATTNKSDTTISTVGSEKHVPEPAQNITTPQTEQQQITENPPKPTTDIQASFSALQQQESFLLVSLQLKKYEDSLDNLKKQQNKILEKQDDQFQTFLNTYLVKQQMIENSMLEQQSRINEHIRHLVTSESSISTENLEETEEKSSGYESVISSLKQRHSEEFFLMEESYKKQIGLLEKSSEGVEERLNQELANMSKAFEDRLESFKKQQQDENKYWTEKIKSIQEKHLEEIDHLKQSHSRLINELKEEYFEQIERLKEAKSQESVLLSANDEASQKLNLGINQLTNNSQVLQGIQDKVVSDYNVLSLAREKSIEAKENEIVLMRTSLERCREAAEKERSQLLGLIRSLEGKIADHRHSAQEERWALQQAAATLAARSAALDREVEFSRASIERERDQLKTLKETLIAEQEKVTLQLTEEKLKLAAEKSRLEVSNKLVKNYEVEKIKTEAEMAIQVAKELTEKLNQERDMIHKQKMDLDNFRRKLVEKERELIDREVELENLTRNAQGRIYEDRKVLQEAKFLENRYKERLAELQSQTIALSSREKKVTEEKLLLSRERLALFTAMKQGKQCMLCKAEDERNLTFGPSEIFDHTISDPELLRLRMEAMEDEKNSEVSKEDSHVITT